MVLPEDKARELRGPPAIDGIGPTGGMDEYWRRADENRRRQAKWWTQETERAA